MPKRETNLMPQEFNTLGELICFLRERAMLTQRDLAARVGYHYSYISRIEKNQHTPTVATLLGRFIPALEIESNAELTRQLIDLASPVDEKADIPTSKQPAVHEEKVYRPPTSLTVLLGRENEVAQIKASLQRQGIRLLTLVGPPGVGKTRLALHIAQQLENHFSTGLCSSILHP